MCGREGRVRGLGAAVAQPEGNQERECREGNKEAGTRNRESDAESKREKEKVSVGGK